MSRKFLDYDGLIYVVEKVKGLIPKKTSDIANDSNFVSDSNYVHTDNNFSADAKTKLDNIEANAQVNTIESIKVNSVVQAIASDKSIDISVPTDTDDLTNSAGYQTADQVNTAIGNALADITSIDYQIVSELPGTGTKGVIYLILNGDSGSNIYNEYIWVNDKFELIGTTAVDLTGYMKTTDMVEISNEEIDTIFNK